MIVWDIKSENNIRQRRDVTVYFTRIIAYIKLDGRSGLVTGISVHRKVLETVIPSSITKDGKNTGFKRYNFFHLSHSRAPKAVTRIAWCVCSFKMSFCLLFDTTGNNENCHRYFSKQTLRNKYFSYSKSRRAAFILMSLVLTRCRSKEIIFRLNIVRK